MHSIPTDLYVVLDRSGSMAPLAGTVVEEVNRLVSAIAADDRRATATVAAFDSERPFDLLMDRERCATAVSLHRRDYQPAHGTPLYDAVAATLTLASRNQLTASRPSRVLVAIVTDGEDNASGLRAVDVLGKVQRRKAAGWDFLYLGVGDVFRDAAAIGLEPGEVHPWQATEVGARGAFATLSATARHRPIRRNRGRHEWGR